MKPDVAYEYANRLIGTAQKYGFKSFFASQHFAAGPNTQIFQPFPLLASLQVYIMICGLVHTWSLLLSSTQYI